MSNSYVTHTQNKSSQHKITNKAVAISDSDIYQLSIRTASSTGVALSIFTVECRNRKSTTDASLLSSVRDKFCAHGNRLDIVVVSKLATLRKSLDTADVNVVQLCVENGTVCIARLGPEKDVPPVCKPYLLCVIVCDEEEIKHTLRQAMGEVYTKI